MTKLPMLVPVLLLAACNQAPSPDAQALQARVIAAEAKANIAEKRARDADSRARLIAQEGAGLEGTGGDDGNAYGQPVLDTAPIDTGPVGADADAKGASGKTK